VKASLQRHIRTVHSREQNYQCPDCDKKCGENSSLQRHIKTVHLKERNYQCPECDYKCGTNSSLQRHIKTVHLKEQNFQCLECDKKFGTNGTLQRHIKTVHLKEQNYQCPDCDYKCGTNSHLQRHIKTVHLKEQNYQCPDCDKKCGENSSLQKHIKTVHLKERNYQCPECDAKFGQNDNLQRHIKTCTGEFTGSSGEYAIIQLLDELCLEKDVDYLYDETYWDVRDKGLLKWDFILNHKDKPMVIEYDGVAHFLPTRFGGISEKKAQDNLKTAQRRDKIKDDHCANNSIPMLRIPYWDKDKIESLVMDFISQNI
jgi:DNA-directed RNA polymerase subunit RPC12/RpoP